MRSKCICVLVWVLTTSVVARAQEHPDPTTMEAEARHDYAVGLTQQGNDAYRDGYYEAAADLYLLAHEYEQNPVLLFNAARCYHRAGMNTVAVEFYWMALDTGELDEETAERAESYVTELFDLAIDEAMHEEINLNLDRAAAAEGTGNYAQAARLYLEAYELPPDPVYSDLNLLMLHADTLVRAEEYDAAIAAFERVKDNRWVSEDQIARADEEIDRAEALRQQALLAAQQPEEPVEPPSKGLSGLQITGLVVAGLGAGALVGGAVIDSGLSGTIDDYEEAAEAGDADRYEDLADDIDSGQTLATILYIGGGVMVGAGIVLFFVGGGDDAADGEPEGVGEEAQAPSLLPSIVPTSTGIGLHWRF